MINRLGNSSILLTASSSDFSYLLKGGTGFVRVLASIVRLDESNYKKLLGLGAFLWLKPAKPAARNLSQASGSLLNSEMKKFCYFAQINANRNISRINLGE
jgi:hypothetical protein